MTTVEPATAGPARAKANGRVPDRSPPWRFDHEYLEDPVAGLVGLMALLGTYVGIIPVALGMLVLPVLRRASRGVVRMLLALTVGLLGFLAVDAAFEGFALAERSGVAFGGPLLVLLGAAFAFFIHVRSIACSTATSEVNKQPPMGGDWR